jgi:hypothetical protein
LCVIKKNKKENKKKKRVAEAVVVLGQENKKKQIDFFYNRLLLCKLNYRLSLYNIPKQTPPLQNGTNRFIETSPLH